MTTHYRIQERPDMPTDAYTLAAEAAVVTDEQ